MLLFQAFFFPNNLLSLLEFLLLCSLPLSEFTFKCFQCLQCTIYSMKISLSSESSLLESSVPLPHSGPSAHQTCYEVIILRLGFPALLVSMQHSSDSMSPSFLVYSLAPVGVLMATQTFISSISTVQQPYSLRGIALNASFRGWP